MIPDLMILKEEEIYYYLSDLMRAQYEQWATCGEPWSDLDYCVARCYRNRITTMWHMELAPKWDRVWEWVLLDSGLYQRESFYKKQCLPIVKKKKKKKIGISASISFEIVDWSEYALGLQIYN